MVGVALGLVALGSQEAAMFGDQGTIKRMTAYAVLLACMAFLAALTLNLI